MDGRADTARCESRRAHLGLFCLRDVPRSALRLHLLVLLALGRALDALHRRAHMGFHQFLWVGLGEDWCGVWYGIVGMVWYMVWYGMVWYRNCKVWYEWYGMVLVGTYGTVRYDVVWYGMVWCVGWGDWVALQYGPRR